MNNKWRFPPSNHGERKGLSSGDVETFKKTPYQSFAREILQNSIDARDSDEEPVKVEFSEFKIKTADIPGLAEYKNQINRCLSFWAHKEDYCKEYKNILKTLESEEIDCLRISDFNTSGLVGVNSTDIKNNKFLALTKGTGVSEKNKGVSAGSKGVGKNAAFNLSKLKMVFYSTLTNDGHKGGLGVTELISGYVNDNENEINRDYTQGTGYFSSDEFNSALTEVITLEEKYSRNVSGTDVLIIGFKKNDGWQKDVINSLLDSFLAAIMRNQLEISFDGHLINSENIENIIYSDLIAKKNRSNIISQYLLLKGNDNVKVFDIETEYGTAQLYILVLDKENEELATHECVMIRHPLMKIKCFSLNKSFRVSAMCIINEDTLGEELRNIENPQHTDWETKRIDDKQHRKEIENTINFIKQEITDKVIECLQLGDTDPLDPYGAGDYLPDEAFGDNQNVKAVNSNTDEVSVSKRKEVKLYEKNPYEEKDDGQGLIPDIGDIDEDTPGDVLFPSGRNDKKGTKHHQGEEQGQKREGENIIFTKSKLAGVRYKVISLNKNEGLLKVVFTAPIDHKNCYLTMYQLDDTNNKTKLKIEKLSLDGKDINSTDFYEFGPFSISTNKKIALNVKTEMKGYFASEVKVVCK